MSILIKGMEMPKNCAYCPLSEYRNSSILDCKQIGTVGTAFRDNNVLKRRHPNCPLIEVPTPHGRLGDLDKLKADHSMKNDCAECEKELQGSSRACEYDRIYSKMDFCQWIDNAETVIEAEGREE